MARHVEVEEMAKYITRVEPLLYKGELTDTELLTLELMRDLMQWENEPGLDQQEYEFYDRILDKIVQVYNNIDATEE
jgi:RNA polymerase-interacting CarD/CdnL/TRCF family regulator